MADGKLLWECGGFNPNNEAMWRVIGSPAISDGIAATYVVSQLEITGSDNQTHKLNYSYAANRNHVYRGSLGFAKMTVTDDWAGTATTKTFHQEFPLTGIVREEKTVRIEPGGEQRVDWRVKAVREGTATIRMSALTDEESDAVEMSFPVYVHGMLKTESYSGALRPDDKQRAAHDRRIRHWKIAVSCSGP